MSLRDKAYTMLKDDRFASFASARVAEGTGDAGGSGGNVTKDVTEMTAEEKFAYYEQQIGV
jgi:hypothetical protein